MQTNKKNSKLFFVHVNSPKPARQKVGPLKDWDGVLRHSNHDIDNLLNVTFSSVFTVEKEDDIPVRETNFEERAINIKISNIKTNSKETEARLENLNLQKSPGPDGFLLCWLHETKTEGDL